MEKEKKSQEMADTIKVETKVTKTSILIVISLTVVILLFINLYQTFMMKKSIQTMDATVQTWDIKFSHQ